MLARAFRQFYERLDDKTDVFYMFFTSGLLHFVAKAVALVPETTNLALIGAGLTADEISWIERHLRRPLHAIPTRTDDKAIWECLFEVSEQNFGWLDVDCFVTNPALFREMATIDDDVAINCTWSYPGPGGRDILRTYFVFLNVAVIRAVQRVVSVSPMPYSYAPMARDRSHPTLPTKPLTPEHVRLLRMVLPSNEAGLPAYPRDVTSRFHYGGFDTLVVYQLMASALGYKVNKVRCLSGISGVREAYSPELFHVGAVSSYKSFRDEPYEEYQYFYRMILQLDYLLLSESGRDFPVQYDALRRDAHCELDRLGISPENARQAIQRFVESVGAAYSALALQSC